jgi:exopolyphosphatase / guanosine-5'-triphosphate,3'-diphosphate pyrophosphatase
MGFNSLKLVIYDVRDDNTFSVLQKETVPTKLGKGIDDYGYLHVDAIERVIDGLKLFADILSLESVKEVIGIATSGVRDCVNKDAFLGIVKKETGFGFKVLSGRDEAVYSFRGAANSVTPSPSILFFDIGGGSLEMVRCENYSVDRVFSLPLGGLRLTDRFSSKKRGYEKMQSYALDILPSKKDLGLRADTVLLGVGGTLRAIARFEQEVNDYPLNKIHNYVMGFQSLEKVHDKILTMGLAELEQNDSIGPSRADTIVAGSLVIKLLMEKLNFRELTVSTHGLRDGVLAAYLEDESWLWSSADARIDKKIFFSHPKVANRIVNTGEISLSLDSVEIIDAFLKRGLISKRELELVSLIVGFLLMKRPQYSAETIFDTIIDQDSMLSHKDQLILALAIVRTISAKSTDRLLVHYQTLLTAKTKSVLKKLAALGKFLEFLEKIRCHVILTPGGINDIRMRIVPSSLEMRRAFPKQLLARLAQDLSSNFAIVVNYELDESTTATPTQVENQFDI